MARSIVSDVDNLLRLISVFNILPPGMYVEQAAAVRAQLLGALKAVPGTPVVDFESFPL